MNTQERIDELIYRFSVLERSVELRRFACWVALQTNPDLKSHIDLVTSIQDSLNDGGPTSRLCYALREEFSGTACAAATVGLRHGCLNAATFLACFSCAKDDPTVAVEDAIKWARHWYKIAVESEADSVFLEHILDKLEAIWSRMGKP